MGSQDIIFGLPWFIKHNPQINWTNGRITILMGKEPTDKMYWRDNRKWLDEILGQKTITINQLPTEEEEQKEIEEDFKRRREEIERIG
jgi:hypothetical protein